MVKMMVLTITGLLLCLATGCQNPKIDDAHLLLTSEETQQAEKQGYLMPESGEADVVEQLTAARGVHQAALEELINYYQATGNATKRRWAQNELTTLKQMAQYRYLTPGELVSADLKASEQIAQADDLYDQAMKLYIEAGGYFIVSHQGKFRESLNLFNKLIGDFPSSDKIDESAYRAGRIYEYFGDYELASVMYQRCFQWNESTTFPARFRAAYLLDQKLKMRTEALTLYKLSVQKEAQYEDNTEYARNRILHLSQPKVELEQAAQPVAEPAAQPN